MKRTEKEEKVLVNIERSPLVISVTLTASALLGWLAFVLLRDINPWGFLAMIPAAAMGFQTLWLLLHPFALVYSDKVEIKQSLIHQKRCYFVDIKKITVARNGKTYLTYHDDEVELLSLSGIRSSHHATLMSEMNRLIAESMKGQAA